MDGTTIYWDTAAREAAAASEPRPRTRLHPGRARKGPLCTRLHRRPSDPGTFSSSKSRIPSQGQTHRAHRPILTMYDPVLLLTLPLEKLPSATKYSFISKCDFPFQNPGRKLETIHSAASQRLPRFWLLARDKVILGPALSWRLYVTLSVSVN